VDWFSRVHGIVAPLIEELSNNEHEMDVDSSTGANSSKTT